MTRDSALARELGLLLDRNHIVSKELTHEQAERIASEVDTIFTEAWNEAKKEASFEEALSKYTELIKTSIYDRIREG